MARVLIVWTFCLALLLLGVTGTHAHRSPGLDPAQTQGHPSITEHSHHEIEHSHAAAELFLTFDPSHIHAHQDHGDIDVDPPTKAFGAVLLIQVICAMLVGLGLLLLITAVWRVVARAPPPFRPPKIRFRPFFLPPSHAPPHTT